MRLEIGSFPTHSVEFGNETAWQGGRLTINRDEVLAAVRRDSKIIRAELELARPGESVRIWPVRDVIEPRVKVQGPGTVYPGICGRAIGTVGQGRTHRLDGVGVVEVSDLDPHDSGGDYLWVFQDMAGPWAELLPTSKLNCVCLIVEADPVLGIHARNWAVHHAALVVSDLLAAAVRELSPPRLETFELTMGNPSLPRVLYLWGLHSPEGKSGSPLTFCSAIYGYTKLSPPWLLHPNEVLDGALNGAFQETPFALSWCLTSNPVLLDLYRRHGRELNFLGCLVYRTEWTTQHEKQLMANQAAKLAQMAGAQGAVVTWDAGGNECMEVVRMIRECERIGIQTVFLTSEETQIGDSPTLIEPLPEARAIVSTGFGSPEGYGLAEVPAVERVIGWPTMIEGSLRDETINAAGALPLPRNGHRDHYGFNRLSAFAY